MKALLVTLSLLLAATSAASTLWALRLRDADRPAWSALGKLPDFGGVWVADRSDKTHPWGIGDPVWAPAAAEQVAALKAVEKAGQPKNYMVDCLPEGMPSFVIMTLNAFEFLYTPGRITILGEFDGNRTRRIYTDGRPHPEDPELTFNGHSIGRWEGDTLVVDTVGVLPQVYLPIGQAVAIPNNGDMHITERIHLVTPNQLRFDLEIRAPRVLAEPWRIYRLFNRKRGPEFDIIEASCRQGDFATGRDAAGNEVFLPIPHDPGGAPLPFDR